MVEHVNKPANAVEEPQPLLEIRNVTKSFDGVVAVDDVSLVINKGEHRDPHLLRSSRWWSASASPASWASG